MKTCSRTAEKEIISFTINFSAIQRRIVSRTLSKVEKRQYCLIMMKRKRRKEFEDEMMIIISSRASDVNSFKKR